MDHQTTINRNRPGRVRQQLGELVHDTLTLAELQFDLLTVDLRDARKGVSAALACLGIGVLLAVGSIPVLLMAGAQALVAELAWPAPVSSLAVGGLAVLLAGLLVWIGARQASAAIGTMQRSKAEFAETLRWFKGSLHRSNRFDGNADVDDPWTSRSRT